MAVSMNHLLDVYYGLNVVHKIDDVKWWNRGTRYSRNDLENAKAVVVILENNNFRQELNDISRGVRSEIKYALENYIPIYLAYKTRENHLYFYKTEVYLEQKRFTGIAGSTDVAIEELKALSQITVNNLQEFWF